MDTIDKVNLFRVWQLFHAEGRGLEVRVLGMRGGARSFFPQSVEELYKVVELHDKPFFNVYVTLNPIDAGQRTPAKDADVTGRRWILLDFDPVRETGVASNSLERRCAGNVAKAVLEHLQGHGIVAAVADSGNGCHLLVPVDLPNDEAATALAKGFIGQLRRMYNTPGVDIDECVWNAARIVRCYGTVNRKGMSPVRDRPWRRSCVRVMVDWTATAAENTGAVKRYMAAAEGCQTLMEREEPEETATAVKSVGSEEKGVECEQVKSVEGEVKGVEGEKGVSCGKEIATNNTQNRKPGDDEMRKSVAYVEGLLMRKGMAFRTVGDESGVKILLEHCPWRESHTGADTAFHDAAVLVSPGGRLGFKCQHSHCAAKDWQSLKQWLLTPETKEYAWGTSTAQFSTLSDFYSRNPKDELEGLLPTGFRGLDSVIHGLVPGDVVILSAASDEGKSTWATSLALNVAERGENVAFFNNEMSHTSFGNRLLLASAKDGELEMGPYGWRPRQDARQEICRRLDGHFVFHTAATDARTILTDMYSLKSVRLIVLDNLMSTSLGASDNDLWGRQKAFMEQLKTVAAKLECTILLVMHTRKSNAKTVSDKDSLYGSSNLVNLAAQIFQLYRKSPELDGRMAESYGKNPLNWPTACCDPSASAFLQILKDRHNGCQGKWLGLAFDGVRKRFVG